MNRTAKSFTIVTTFSIVTRLISFAFKIWVSRALGAETVGLYQIASSVLMLLFTLTSGAPTVLSRKVAATPDIKRQNSFATASLILGLGFSSILLGIFYGLSGHIGFLFSDERCLPIFLILLPTLVTSTAYATLRSWFWGRKNFLAFSSTELVDEVIKIVLSFVFAGGLIATIDGARGIALAATLSDAVCVLILLVLYFVAGGRLTKPSGFKELTLRTIPLSATRILTSLTASMTAVVLPQLLVKYGMTAAEATAEYGRIAGMALPLIMAPVMFVSSLSIVLIPDIAELKAKGDLQTVRAKLSASLVFATLIAAVFFVLYLPLGKHVGNLLFGDEKAGVFVSNCSAMLFVIVLAQVTGPMLNSLGKEKVTLLSSILGAAAMVPCVFLLPKYVGVYAMAIGSACCFTVMTAVNFVGLYKEVGHFLQPSKLLKTVAFALPLALLGYFSERLLCPVAGRAVTVIVLAVFLIFFLFIFISAFDIVDIVGYLRLMRPAKLFGKRKKRGDRRMRQV